MLPLILGIPAYPLGAALAIGAGCLLLWPGLKQAGLTPRQRGLMLLAITLAFLSGARLWNLAIAPINYGGQLQWYSLRWSGLSLYGGLLGALLAALLLARIWRLRIWPLLDASVIPGGVAFCIARLGCFCAGCCGGKATASRLGLVFPSQAASRQALAELLPLFPASQAVYPTQLFELAGAALGLPLCVMAGRRLRFPPGGRFLLYTAWFCAMRLIVLPFRASAYPAWVTDWFYPLLYAALAVAATLLLIRRKHKHPPGPGPASGELPAD